MTGFPCRAAGALRALALATIVALGAGHTARADFHDGLQAYEARDFRTANVELEPLASAGDARAQKLVGLMYRDGQGVPQDFVRAHLWLNLAAASGDTEAIAARDELGARMDPGQIAEAQRLASRWQLQSAAAPTAVPIASTAGAPTAPVVDATPLTRAGVMDLQWQLAVHGYDPGPADGIVGPRTRLAIAQYQADAGLAADSAPTQGLLDHARFAEPPVMNTRPRVVVAAAPSVVIVEGDEHEDAPSGVWSEPAAPSLRRIYTVAVQQALIAQGYRPGPADGVVGPRTRRAIRTYQRNHGLPVTGIVSQALINHLRLVTGGAT